MGTSTALRQLLKSLCCNTQWKYVVLWKLKHMQLFWEDSYLNNEISDGFRSGELGIISFGCKTNTQDDNPVEWPIGFAMASMSCCSYRIGEGIIGKVASRGKHQWTFARECVLLEEFPEEWKQQFIAGIKTILLVPVIPLGVVQLGSLDIVVEDLREVVRVRDYFSTFQNTSNISSLPRMDHLDCNAPFTMSPPFMVQSDLHLGFDMMNEHTWDSTFSNMLGNRIDETPVDLSIFAGNMTVGDMPTFSFLDDELNPVSSLNHCLISGQPILLTPCMKEYEQSAYSHGFTLEFDEGMNSMTPCMKEYEQSAILLTPCMKEYEQSAYSHGFTLEFDEGMNSMMDQNSLSFPSDCELHKVLGQSTEGYDGCTWDTILAKANEWNSSAHDVHTPNFGGESSWFTNERGTDHLLDVVIAELLKTSNDDESGESRCTRSCSNSSGKCSEFCLTDCKNEESVFEPEESVLRSHKRSMFVSDNEDSINSTKSSTKNTVSISPSPTQMALSCGLQKRAPKSMHVSRKRGDTGDARKPKPRDRQLIQDRIKELRELIPNSSKCSIDALLDQTIKHMSFLQSVPSHAEKLKSSSHLKVKVEDRAPEDGASWVYEVGGREQQCPLIVENLDQPGQLLVEMLCDEYGFFLEIAQVIKRLKLTILKGVLDMKSDRLWAHFIIETPKGFHRMDILWPLVQLLQRNNNVSTFPC